MAFETSIPEATVQFLRKQSAEAELSGRLTEAQRALVHRHRWYRLFVPENYGGLELSLPEAVRLEENIAYADGSLGWVVTLCAGAGLFIGYFDPALATEIFSDPIACIAGSGQSGGEAQTVPGGFIINGSWPYASGAPDATYFTANCRIDEGESIRSFVFRRDEVDLHATWNYIGLHASAGYSFSVRRKFVPRNRAFQIDPHTTVLPQPIYRYPFLQLAEATIAANIAAMCAFFFDLAGEYFRSRKLLPGRAGTVALKGLQSLQITQVQVAALRASAYEALEHSWAAHLCAQGADAAQLEAVSATSKAWARQSRNLVNELYPYCGLNAARTDVPINQVWRNINTASQHTILL